MADLRRISRRTTPRAVFDYVDGAADGEVTLHDNTRAFAEVRFVPRLLQPVSNPDLSSDLLGKRISFPVVLGPTGFTRMMHHEGEAAVARAAHRAGLPYTLSTLGTTDIEGVWKAAPHGNNWFQLYMTNDKELNMELLRRAANAGSTTLVLTTDCAVGGKRLRDARAGLTIPPSLTLRTFLDMGRFPSWWLNKLTTSPVEFASVRQYTGTNADVARLLFEPDLDYDDFNWLRQEWPHRLLVKGVLNPLDARRLVDLGADGVVVSNHGGRQLDRTPATLEVLPSIRKAVGEDATVLIDGGVTHGQDIVAARALGADAVMVGRAYLFGLMTAGERGVDHVLGILRDEYQRALQLMGLGSTSAIDEGSVVLRSSPGWSRHLAAEE